MGTGRVRVGRPGIRRVDPPRARGVRDALLVVGIVLVLLFALIGIVSAGSFVGSKFSSAAPTPQRPVQHQAAGSSSSTQDVSRARTEATRIVASARAVSHSMVASAARRAKQKAKSIVNAAESRVIAAPPLPTSAPAQVSAPPVDTAPRPTVGLASSSPKTRRLMATISIPGLNNLPSTWLVVAYNPSFGSGRGSAGTITVANRSSRTFSGEARLRYTFGGFASAFFSALRPGQVSVLPLHGKRYRGGGYRLQVLNLH